LRAVTACWYVKGDMAAKLPGEPLLVAPQDGRSRIWDVASDCRTKQDGKCATSGQWRFAPR
jgi:Type IV secretion-system coupling protein DNA-binding domain